MLTDMLAAFAAVVSLGTQHAGPPTLALFRVFATLEIAGMGLWWMYSRDNNIGHVIFRVLTLAVFFWIMRDWQLIAGMIQASFIQLGLILGGNHLPPGSVHSAGMTFINKGYELSLAIQGVSRDPAWWEQVGQALVTLAPTTSAVATAKWFTSWCVWVAFLLAGVHLFATQLEFVFVSAITFLTIPFACWHRTAWLTERTFGAVVGSGLKLAFLYMLASAAIPVLDAYVVPVVPSQQHAMHILGVGFLILCLQIGAHKLAAGVLHGMPSFTQSDVMPRLAPIVSVGMASTMMAARTIARAGTALKQRIGHTSSGRTP